ncbi:aminoglycoside nucleotidyltransferase ANT(2'')-Ia [Chloroflexia bacterium SDU3-3]|nr:aminoglycoside nucleotidyltransferase ANT(2'')-Ia [Chloroflexia bacterium SDU3-3]
MNDDQIALIHRLMQRCDALSLPIWLESGWAVDARLGRVTREHSDIDLAFPAERIAEFTALLRSEGASNFEQMDYGFLAALGGVLLDCEPCLWDGRAYELAGMPPGSCPAERQGSLAGRDIRCISWDAILWEYFGYLDELPFASWPQKDVDSYRLVCATLGEPHTANLYQRYRAQNPEL